MVLKLEKQDVSNFEVAKELAKEAGRWGVIIGKGLGILAISPLIGPSALRKGLSNLDYNIGKRSDFKSRKFEAPYILGGAGGIMVMPFVFAMGYAFDNPYVYGITGFGIATNIGSGIYELFRYKKNQLKKEQEKNPKYKLTEKRKESELEKPVKTPVEAKPEQKNQPLERKVGDFD